MTPPGSPPKRFRSIRKGGQVGTRLTDQSVADIVKAHAQRVGFDVLPGMQSEAAARVDDVMREAINRRRNAKG